MALDCWDGRRVPILDAFYACTSSGRIAFKTILYILELLAKKVVLYYSVTFLLFFVCAVHKSGAKSKFTFHRKHIFGAQFIFPQFSGVGSSTQLLFNSCRIVIGGGVRNWPMYISSFVFEFVTLVGRSSSSQRKMQQYFKYLDCRAAHIDQGCSMLVPKRTNCIRLYFCAIRESNIESPHGAIEASLRGVAPTEHLTQVTIRGDLPLRHNT
jgi:hypothetical protein